MPATTGDMAYFSRGEFPGYVVGKVATTGLDTFGRTELYPAVLLLAAATAVAIADSDTFTLDDTTETLDEITLLTELLEVILSTSRTITYAEVLATLTEVAAALSNLVASDSVTVTEAAVLDATAVAATPTVTFAAGGQQGTGRRQQHPMPLGVPVETRVTIRWSVLTKVRLVKTGYSRKFTWRAGYVRPIRKASVTVDWRVHRDLELLVALGVI